MATPLDTGGESHDYLGRCQSATSPTRYRLSGVHCQPKQACPRLLSPMLDIFQSTINGLNIIGLRQRYVVIRHLTLPFAVEIRPPAQHTPLFEGLPTLGTLPLLQCPMGRQPCNPEGADSAMSQF